MNRSSTPAPVESTTRPGYTGFVAASVLLHGMAVVAVALWAGGQSRPPAMELRHGSGGLRVEWLPAKTPENPAAPAASPSSPPAAPVLESRRDAVRPIRMAEEPSRPVPSADKPSIQAVPQTMSAQAPASEGVTVGPRAAFCPAPPYPASARRAGKAGTVRLQLVISQEGRVTHARIVESSGRRDLDEAARDTILKRWKYQPAERAGVAVSTVEVVRVEFKLENT